MNQPTLRPQDIVVLAKLLVYSGLRPPLAHMAVELSLSPSQVHASLKRLTQSGLLSSDPAGNRPLLRPVLEFLVHGLKYAFPAKRGVITRGVPPSYAAPPLNRKISPGSDLPPVWPFSDGQHRGVSLEPFYKAVPVAALRDQPLYELLAIIDALREGRARERELAEKELILRLQHLDEQPKSESA